MLVYIYLDLFVVLFYFVVQHILSSFDLNRNLKFLVYSVIDYICNFLVVLLLSTKEYHSFFLKYLFYAYLSPKINKIDGCVPLL